MRSKSVPSSGTSEASVLADTSTSPAAWAGSERHSARPSALPILLGFTSLPQVGLLLGEPPDLKILLARPQGVQQALRLGPVHGLVAARLRLGLLPLLVRVLRIGLLGIGRIGLLRRLLLLRLRGLLRRRLLLFALRFPFLRLRLLLLTLLRGPVLLRLPRRVPPPLLLRPQQELQVDLGVDVVRIEGQCSAVLPHRLVRLSHRLEREGHLVRRLRLQRRVASLQGAGGLAGGGARHRRIDLEHRGGAVERDSGVLREPRSRLVVLRQRALRVVLRQKRVAARHVVV